MSIILKAENISKQYRLGTVGTGTLGDDLKRWWYSVRGKEDPFLKVGGVNDRSAKATEDYIWGLRDINFEVKQGEVLGIIGKNGAGKSTLLKLLSRVTSPTTGSIKTKGRIASLLEIGTGFHPELTGRENIFMNGAVLGMTRAEIKNKLDEIIAFSGCEMYIDTPVKRYSSGMTVRLGFAVAAHLEPEILVVDEVLAVGDAEFQKKAIGKMQDLSTGEGRTVIFVSHNMASIQNLCTRVMLMNNGQNEKIGFTDEVVDYYLEKFRNTFVSKELENRLDRKGNGQLKFLRYWFENKNGNQTNSLQSGMNCKMILEIINTSERKINNIRISVGIDDNQSRRITLLDNTLTNVNIQFEPIETRQIKIAIPNLPLQGGQYYFTLFASENDNIADWVINAGEFEVEFGDYFNTGKVVKSSQGNFLTQHKFSVNSK
ncbi:lipopolysaccharide transport system ATP-binding protein [Salegentibacter holothuriorum]|uniref:Lipopolysaccharide transport system ATP-binding protein n=1 Tax=Salegentibacter holothuriorum TaxID=241145 RepID=A0A1T5CL35_9FLAO|nr:ABC transporter ATP-binding protein [Salegentibacter holothuriorum]SKB60157.1 lipopolysaccharide transport system ATP-binding protein [Salegentibacter holothuriorum]